MLNKKNIFIGCGSDYQTAKFVLFGAPFDGTTTYRPGARFAPKRMREESYGIETYSPYLDKDLSEINVFDAGDLDLPFGSAQKALGQIQEFAYKILSDGKIPVMIGGEHLVTLAAVKAIKQKCDDLYVIDFDAHADLRDEYLGEKLSHSTVMRRVCEVLGPKKIFQYAIRSGERTEFEYAKDNTYLTKFVIKDLKKAIDIIGDKPVYLTFDLDCLDPSEFAATGTPEAGGVSFEELREAAATLGKLNVVGCDITELCPPYDTSGTSIALACKFLRELLLSI
ncbi:MAG: agmatinase [Clostridiales bacterium]|jgi:agmatinase|nr:agmatinase [Clostridiales bacterium]